MFRTLRKIVTVGMWAFAVGVGLWVYQCRSVFEPLGDWVDVMVNRKSVPQVFQEQISGTVTKVVDGGTFQLRDEQGRLHAIRLVGVDAPVFTGGLSRRADLLAARSRTNLSSLVLSNQVVADLTHATPQRAGVGVVRSNGTNINEMVARTGWGKVKRDHIRSLPVADQVRLIQSEREAREAGLGVWKTTLVVGDANPPSPPDDASPPPSR
jgi:endonuclease YncB( thermonuclease family)